MNTHSHSHQLAELRMWECGQRKLKTWASRSKVKSRVTCKNKAVTWRGGRKTIKSSKRSVKSVRPSRSLSFGVGTSFNKRTLRQRNFNKAREGKGRDYVRVQNLVHTWGREAHWWRVVRGDGKSQGMSKLSSTSTCLGTTAPWDGFRSMWHGQVGGSRAPAWG